MILVIKYQIKSKRLKQTNEPLPDNEIDLSKRPEDRKFVRNLF